MSPTLAHLHENEPHPLQDGLLISTPEDIRAQVATWTVLVIIESPTPPQGISEKLTNFRHVLELLYHHRPPSNTTRMIWDQHITDMEDALTSSHSAPRVRRRRGLLNIVGEISSKLFGTATQSEVEECERHINSAMKLESQIVHTTNDLITVVNQTHSEVRRNMQHIRDMEHYMGKLYTETTRLGKIASGNNGRITELQDDARVDRILAALGSVQYLWQRQCDRYQRQRASLELGWLTEEILPLQDLVQILESSRELGHFGPRSEWYYEHIQIHPMWEDQNKLVFKAELPLVDETEYLRYRISSWPVPRNTSDYTLQIQVPSAVAIDTRHGGIFEPHTCIGNQPGICRAGPIYGAGRLLCARSILNGDSNHYQSCAVTVTRVDAPIGTVKEVTPTIFVLLSFGETYSVHCPKKPERANYLPLGIYTLRVAATCQVRGKEWLLSGTVRYNSTLKYVNPFLSVDTLNLPQLLPDELVRQQLERPEWKHLPAITDLTIQKLKLPPKVSHPGWNTGPDHPYHSGWITAGVSITFSVGVTIFILRKWGNTRWCKKTDTIPKSRDAETASELQSLGPTWVALTQPASPSPGGTAESSN